MNSLRVFLVRGFTFPGGRLSNRYWRQIEELPLLTLPGAYSMPRASRTCASIFSGAVTRLKPTWLL